MNKLKMRTLNLIVALYVTGCGAANDPVGTNTQDSNAVTNQKQDKTNQNQMYSYAVADHDSLPACDAAHEGELAYVRADKSLQACDQGEWAKIDLTGPQGPQGEKGDSVTFSPTPTPVALAPNEFMEQSSGLIWVKVTGFMIFTNAQASCKTASRRLPTEKELGAALVLGSVKPNGGNIWADTGKLARGDVPGLMIDAETTDSGYVYCVKD